MRGARTMDAEQSMDLNLIKVFVAVYEARNLTTAARRLFVTQPAVSQSLARLRRELDDPLFRRNGRSLEATPLADSVYPGFREAMAGVDRTLDAVHRFDPADTSRLFRIALSELGEIGWFPAILSAVRAVAPHVRLTVVALDPAELPSWLARGSVDLAISTASIVGVERTLVKSQSYGVAMSRSSRLSSPVNLRQYSDADHVVVSSDSGHDQLETAQRRAGASVEASVTIDHWATLPTLLSMQPDLLATVPDSIAEGWAQTWPIRVEPLPFEMAPVEVYLYRRATTAHTAALDWLFTTVAGAVRASSGRFFAIHGDAHRTTPQ